MSRRLLSLLCVLLAPAAAHAQLQIKRDLPPIAWDGCPATAAPVAAPAADARVNADHLVQSATEASLLGNHQETLNLLSRAAALDPSSAATSYRLARTLESTGNDAAAVEEYCRYLQLPGASDTADVRARIAELTAPAPGAVSRAAVAAFQDALERFDAGDLIGADSILATAHALAPSWHDVTYNRGVVLAAIGQREPAAVALRTYLEARPDAPDFELVLDAVSRLRSRTTYSPTAALVSGIIVPGLGHFTTGRPVAGAVFLAGAGGALATGLLIEKTHVECLGVPVNGQCPPDQVGGTRSERPYLLVGAGVAAAIAIAGAIDAYVGARRSADSPPALLRIDSGPGAGASLERPVLTVGPDGAGILLMLRF